MAAKIRKGDRVIVLTGRDKGKKGSVLRVDPSTQRAAVQGINMVKRHTAPRAGDTGGIRDIESMIHLSNLAIEDPKTGKPSRVGFKVLEDGRKVRVARRSGEVVDA
jgi:large subunit ribosomal protein L24